MLQTQATWFEVAYGVEAKWWITMMLTPTISAHCSIQLVSPAQSYQMQPATCKLYTAVTATIHGGWLHILDQPKERAPTLLNQLAVECVVFTTGHISFGVILPIPRTYATQLSSAGSQLCVTVAISLPKASLQHQPALQDKSVPIQTVLHLQLP